MLLGMLSVAWADCVATSPGAVQASVQAALADRGDGRLPAAQSALAQVPCADDWISPTQAAQIHQLAAQVAGEDADPATVPGPHVLGMGRALSPPDGASLRLLPEQGACLWRVDGWPADGGTWGAVPGAAAIVQRRCADTLLQTWLLPDDTLPGTLLAVDGPRPLPPQVLQLSPAPQTAAAPPLPAPGGPLLPAERHLLLAAGGSMAASVILMSVAGGLRVRYQNGLGDAGTLEFWNGATASLGALSGAASVGLLLRAEDLRHGHP